MSKSKGNKSVTNSIKKAAKEVGFSLCNEYGNKLKFQYQGEQEMIPALSAFAIVDIYVDCESKTIDFRSIQPVLSMAYLAVPQRISEDDMEAYMIPINGNIRRAAGIYTSTTFTSTDDFKSQLLKALRNHALLIFETNANDTEVCKMNEMRHLDKIQSTLTMDKTETT